MPGTSDVGALPPFSGDLISRRSYAGGVVQRRLFRSSRLPSRLASRLAWFRTSASASVLAVGCLTALPSGLAACGGAVGGEYAPSGRRGGDVDHGETNGRRFDFVSNKPDLDEWVIRVTGSSMWVSFAQEESTDKLGSFNLSEKETRKLWKLIDALDIPGRKGGKRDEDVGYVSLRLKEPDPFLMRWSIAEVRIYEPR